MAYDKNVDYTALIAKETDDARRKLLEQQKSEKIADIQKAGLNYQNPIDLATFRNQNTQSVQTPSQYQYTENELAAQKAGAEARAREAAGITENVDLVSYIDQGGNIQRIRKDQISNVPKEWKLYTGQVSTNDASLDAMKKAQLESAKSSLGATRENILSKLSEQKKQIEPRIAQSRASAVSGTAIAQKRLADLIPFSGTMMGAQVAQGEQLNTDLQARQSELDIQKEQAYKDIANQEIEAERLYQQGISQAEADAMQEYQQRLLEQQKIADERAYQEQQAKTQQEREDYLSNIGQFQKDYTAEINRLMAEGVPENDYRMMALKSERAKKVAALDEAKQNAYIQALKDEQDKQEQAFELAKWRFDNGLPATQMDAQLLGVPVGKVSPAQAIKQAELVLSQQRKASSSSSGTKLTYNQALTQARQILGNSASAQSVVDLATQLQSGATSGLSNTANVSQPTSNKATDALKYLSQLESARDLVSINAFIQNNQSEIDRIASNPNETTSNRNAAQEIQRLYYKYK